MRCTYFLKASLMLFCIGGGYVLLQASGLEQVIAKPTIEDVKALLVHRFDPRPSELEALIAAGLDLEARDDEGCTPLMVINRASEGGGALSYDRLGGKMMQILLAAGACVNARDEHGDTVLMQSVKRRQGDYGYYSLGPVEGKIKDFCAAGLDVHAQNSEGKTILMLLIEGLEDCGGAVFEFLLREGGAAAGIESIVDKEGKTAADYAALYLRSGDDDEWKIDLFEEAREYEQRKRKWHIKNCHKQERSFRRSFPSAQALEEWAQKQPGWHPTFKHFKKVLSSLGKRKERLIQLQALIDAGLDLEERNTLQETPLMFTLRYFREYNCRRDFMRLLLSAGANLEAKNEHTETILLQVLEESKISFRLVRDLFIMGADVTGVDFMGNTALMLLLKNDASSSNAVKQRKKLRLVKAFIQAGALVNAQNEKGRTIAMQLAIPSYTEWNRKFLREVIKGGADVQMQDAKGNTALMLMIKKTGHVDHETIFCMDELLEAGAGKVAKTLRNNKGKSAFDYACENDSKKELRELLESDVYADDGESEDADSDRSSLLVSPISSPEIEEAQGAEGEV